MIVNSHDVEDLRRVLEGLTEIAKNHNKILEGHREVIIEQVEMISRLSDRVAKLEAGQPVRPDVEPVRIRVVPPETQPEREARLVRLGLIDAPEPPEPGRTIFARLAQRHRYTTEEKVAGMIAAADAVDLDNPCGHDRARPDDPECPDCGARLES